MFDNRVTVAIEALTTRIEALSAASLASLTATVADGPEPALRQLMAERHADGTLPLAEANTLYAIAEDWSGQSVAARVAWYQVAAELAQIPAGVR